MILIFDLDDTLYEERTYVNSGFMAVAEYGYQCFGWDITQSYELMQSTLERHGRGKVFDFWLDFHGKLNRTVVADCLRIYRGHTPALTLTSGVRELLEYLIADHPLYLVTDGNKNVQKKKVDALGIEHLFRKVMITHRYGINHAKPSTYCFGAIKRREKCNWSDMVYVGDNPTKDFVNLKPLGVSTVRVKTGNYRDFQAGSELDADYSVLKLRDIMKVLNL